MTKRTVVVALVVGMACLSPATARGQRVGDRVRVPQGRWIPEEHRRTGDDYLEGRFQALAGDTLVMQVDGPLIRVPLGETGGFELGRVVGHEAERGAMIGGGIGLAVGAGVAASRDDELNPTRPDDDEWWSFDDGQIGAVVLGTALGAGLGAVVGYAWKKIRWSTVSIPSTRPELVVGRDGRTSFGLRVFFP